MDVIILDIEMPVMDGLDRPAQTAGANPQARIIMASTLTQRNAAVSLKALTLGATDYIAKPTTDKLNANEDFRRDLVQKVIALGRQRKSRAQNPIQRPHVTPTLSPHANRGRTVLASSPSAAPPADRKPC